MRTRNLIALAVGAIVAALAIAACGGNDGDDDGDETAAQSTLPSGSEPVEIDPADFTTEIDNPYWPMTPGSKWVYTSTDAKGAEMRVEVTVTDQTKKIAVGVEARVVHDLVTEDGEPVEDTYDWYAQDSAGNLWYFGEDTKEFENGKVKTTEGSWESGVDGAQPGIMMPAEPQTGQSYREEYRAGVAEDQAEILAVDEPVDVPFGHFDSALKTKNFTPLEPKLIENKFYVRDVGPVLELLVAGGSEREELVSYTRG